MHMSRNNVAITKFADGERMESVLVTACIDAASCHDHKGECAVKHIECILERVDTRLILVDALLLDKVCKHLSVRV